MRPFTGNMEFTKIQQKDESGDLMEINTFIPGSVIQIINGELSLKLGTPNDQALEPAAFIYSDFTSTSGLELLITDMVINVDEENETEHGLVWGDFDPVNPENLRQIIFVYANQAGTISGVNINEYGYENNNAHVVSMDLEQGWNTVIWSNYFDDEMDLDIGILVTEKPGDTFKWYVTEIFSESSDEGGGPGGPGWPPEICRVCELYPCECE